MKDKGTIFLILGGAGVALGAVLLIKHVSGNKQGGNKPGDQKTPPPANDYAEPGKDYVQGKTAYAVTDNVRVWEGPAVDEGYWWDVTGLSTTVKYNIPNGNIAGWVVEGPVKSTDPADINKWYKIRVYTVSPSPAIDYGYVRSDVIEIK